MSTLLLLVTLFAVINTLIKLSYWKSGQIIAFGVVLAGFIFLVYSAAIGQSQTSLEQYLAQPEIRKNLTVLLCLETIIHLIFGISYMKGDNKRKLTGKFIHFFPSILIFPILFYLLTQTVFTFAGVDFSRISMLFALGTAVIIPAMAFLFKHLLSDTDFRSEILILSSILVVILGLISTYTGILVYKGEYSIHIRDIALILGAILVFAATGWGYDRVSWHLKKINNG